MHYSCIICGKAFCLNFTYVMKKKNLKGIFHIFSNYEEVPITALFINTIDIFIADACNLTKPLAVSAYFVSIKSC